MYIYLLTLQPKTDRLTSIIIHLNTMKTKYFFMAVACLMGGAASATEMNDTVVVDKPSKVMVMTNDTVQSISIFGKEGDDSFRYQSSVAIDKTKTADKIKKAVTEDEDKVVFDLGVGWAAPTNTPSGHGFATFRSVEWYFGLRYCYSPKGKTQTYSTGLWCDWRSYTVPKGNMIGKNADDLVVYDTYENFNPKATKTDSKIRIFSLSVPFLFTQKFGKKSKFSFTLGPVVNFNLYGRIYNEYTLDDSNFEVGTKNFNYRPITVDIMGMVKYAGVGLYCKYSPMSVLKKKEVNGVENPQFKSLTFGLFF